MHFRLMQLHLLGMKPYEIVQACSISSESTREISHSLCQSSMEKLLVVCILQLRK